MFLSLFILLTFNQVLGDLYNKGHILFEIYHAQINNNFGETDEKGKMNFNLGFSK